MKRTVLVVLVGLLVGILTVDAGAARVRKSYEGNYQAPAPGACGEVGGHRACLYAYDCLYSKSGCAYVDLKRPASRVRIEIADTSGLPVLAQVFVPGHDEPLAVLCASPGKSFPVNVYGATEVRVHVITGTCPDSTPSTPTTGVVRVTRG